MVPHFLLQVHFRLHGCKSLKEKRSRMAPLLSRLKKENISVAETDLLDAHQEAVLSITKVGIDIPSLNRDLDQLITLIDANRADMDLIENKTEIFV